MLHYVSWTEWNIVHNAVNTVLCLVFTVILTNIELLHKTELLIMNELGEVFFFLDCI